uniref:Uncharacterized protein n=1 Tax=Ditylenchus dipsaci TaxID=166011 RepID=A0A915D7W3_9BILA
MGARRRRGRLLPHYLSLTLVLAILIQPINTQFGEIASVITGLLGSGGGLAGAGTGAASGLGGLSGLSGLAGAGASAGSGAASALGGVGQLYQLAQAALQLTGTGVGIANQASESAWFPVAVENAAKMNRDFQDRLLRGGAGAGVSNRPGLPGLPGLG